MSSSSWYKLFTTGVANLLKQHRRLLAEHPYKTNAATSGVLMCLGDRFAQHQENKNHEYDSRSSSGSSPHPPPLRTTHESLTRTGILTFWSGGVSSPFWTWWYAHLHRKYPGKLFAWVFLTALVPAPIWNCFFFCFSTLAEHALLTEDAWRKREEGYQKVEKKLREQFIPTVTRSAQLWIPVNVINFYFVPYEFRMLAGSAVAFGWNVYLSLTLHK